MSNDWYIRRDAIARQTAAWLFTLSEDENRVIARIVDRVRAATPQYGHLDLRADKRDWNGETADELTDALFYLCAEQVKRHLARVDAIDSAPADTVVPHDGERTHGGNFCQAEDCIDCKCWDGEPQSLSAAGRHGAVGEPQTPLISGHETPTGGDSRGCSVCGATFSCDCAAKVSPSNWPCPTCDVQVGTACWVRRLAGCNFVDCYHGARLDLAHKRADDLRAINAGLRELAGAKVETPGLESEEMVERAAIEILAAEYADTYPTDALVEAAASPCMLGRSQCDVCDAFELAVAIAARRVGAGVPIGKPELLDAAVEPGLRELRDTPPDLNSAGMWRAEVDGKFDDGGES